jgi:hypothetical protein
MDYSRQFSAQSIGAIQPLERSPQVGAIYATYRSWQKILVHYSGNIPKREGTMRTYNQDMRSFAISKSDIQCMRIVKRTLAGIMKHTAAEVLRNTESVIG